MNLTGGRVLILDDESLVGRMTARMAQHLGFEAVWVSGPSEFFGKVGTWHPTHVILDLIMPEVDGVQVLQQLAAQGCEARIAISSGAGSRVLGAAQLSAVEHGLRIASLLPKPINITSLREFLLGEQEMDTIAEPEGNQVLADDKALRKEEIEQALGQGQLRLDFQPKIDCVSRRLIGVEALVRWDHPDRGLLMPDQFIAVSEAFDLIGPITDQVVDLALGWYIASPGVAGMSLAINISARTLEEQAFVDSLSEKCRTAGMPCDLVVLELTETAALHDKLLALDMFTRLRMKGFCVSIDDFGTGQSSMTLLARLPFSEVKLDKSFAISAAHSRESRVIIKSTVDLSHSLGLSVVTEGVEDRSTLDFLEEIGCDSAQGYYIARPMSGDELIQWTVQQDGLTPHDPAQFDG